MRLNSGVRRRQTKIFSTWGSPSERRCDSQCPSATYSVQLESSCTPSVVAHPREKLAGAQNQFCATCPGRPSVRGLLRPAGNSSLVSRLTIRSSRVRFAASAACRYDWATAAAAQLPGLAQALGWARPTSTLERFCFRHDGLGVWPRFAELPCLQRSCAGRVCNVRTRTDLAHSIFCGHGRLSIAIRQRAAGPNLTIRSSRVRFAASTAASYD